MRIHVDDQSTCMLLNASAAKANTRELMKKAKAFVARETVRAEANVEAQRAQALECERAVPKIPVTSGTMHHVKFWLQSFEQLEIVFG